MVRFSGIITLAKLFIVITGSLISNTVILQGQIIYSGPDTTDIVFPTENPSSNYYFYDIDADGTDDIVFKAHFSIDYHPHGDPFYNNVLTVRGLDEKTHVATDPLKVFFLGDVIDRTSFFEDDFVLLEKYEMYGSASCIFAEDDYLGFRKEIGGFYHYGWIRLDCWCDWGS